MPTQILTFINIHPHFEVFFKGKENESYIISVSMQRIAMTLPPIVLLPLNILLERFFDTKEDTLRQAKTMVLDSIVGITGTTTSH
jgi:hypothetical protein